MTTVSVAWAAYGKPAKSAGDYQIMASGGPVLDAGDLTVILSWFALGNPPPERTGPGALPWAAVSVVQKDGQHYVGVATYRWSAEHDRAGRPIMSSLHFFLPYELLRERGVSYRAFLGAVTDVELPPPGTDLLIELDAMEPEETVGVIERLGRDRVERAAAMLLDGPVTVTASGNVSFADRLAFIDAVAALLPYGWRTRFAAGTWFDGGGSRIGLAFSRRDRPGSTELRWPAPARPQAGGSGEAYLAWLEELMGRHGRSLAWVVDELAGVGEPFADRPPADAVQVLRDLGWPTALLLAARAGEAVAGDLAALFQGGRYGEVAKADAEFLFDRLVELATADDLGLVERLWKRFGGRPETLIRGTRSLLWRPEPDPAIRGRAHLAERLGFGAEFVAGVIRPLRGDFVGTDACAAAAQLVHMDAPEDAPRVPAALAENAPVLAELLVQVARSDGDHGGWLRALTPVAAESLLTPFRQIWSGDVSAAQVTELAGHGRLCVFALVRMASALGRLEHLLPALAAWIDHDSTAGWKTWLGTLSPEKPRGQGALDALACHLGAAPRHLAHAARPGYIEGFRDVRRALPATPAADTLAAHLTTFTWAAEPALTAGVVAVAAEFPRHARLVRVLLAGRAASTRLTGDENYRHWRGKVHPHHPELFEEEIVTILGDLPANADPEATGDLCALALLEGNRPEEVAALLLKAGRAPDDRFVLRLLLRTRHALIGHRMPEKNARDNVILLANALMRGLSAEAAARFRHSACARSAADMRFQFDLILMLSQDPRHRNRVVLDEEAAGRLRFLTGSLLHVVGRPSRFWRR
ncbi:hypothetical protein [Actinomadura harenae]|uniref:Uncharacterized protein n=1 Tax=Actinomadura harenae TaxID=2483351 RepID=A0A3M2LLA1_9ACTN|nr:hypothetical protein [Actinomadura harenae]RMI38207.1 hypothetical protein EBO15_33585 [Actinomadura harenae]